MTIFIPQQEVEDLVPTLGKLPEGKKLELVLGFDFGTQNLGIAVGNLLTHTAQPLKIIPVKNNQPDWAIIENYIQEWTPGAFIVGMPYTQDGTVTEHLQIIRKFMNRLHGRFGLPVYEVDESQSSIESQQFIKPSQRNRKGQLDAISAAIIVERWLSLLL